ncbi:MAG: SrfA family protein [Burkholderiaceae bacterium]|jgi:hypothetical protein|nr:SrfA family protein [Burkholderiaceae bacterium]
MAGSLLVSGNPQHYKAIGEGGQPVYAVAFQLREAIRLKAGASTANCLGIPQSNQHGSMVDWYAPVEGDVVPWSAASSQEREYALARLDAAHRTLESAIEKMRLAESRDGQAEREKNTVLPLMSKVFYFPDTQFIYLVNGEPVIAFWGFHTQGAGLPADPFVSLRPVSAATVAPTVAALNKPARRAWWWWLLLLLLLLLLLFFLWRSCAPVTPLPSSSSSLPALPTQTVKPPVLPGQSVVPVDSSVRTVPDGWIDRGVSTVRRWWSGSDPRVGVSVPVAGADLASRNEAPGSAPADLISPAPGGDVAANSQTPDAGAPVAQSPTAESSTLEPPSVPIVPPLTPPQSTQQVPPPLTITPPDLAATQPGSGNTPVAQPLGRPMTIPRQAINGGDTRFLDGKWSAGTGIQDAKTGKPLRIEYDFSQGKGQGKVTIRRTDGSQCVGAVSAQMQGNSLQINDGGVATCSDGGSIALPKVTCTPQPDGQANCQGRYENGATFPVSMRHAPK